MMSTVLFLGMNDETVKTIAKISQNDWFALDTYRRFLEMFGTSVLCQDKQLYAGTLPVVITVSTNALQSLRWWRFGFVRILTDFY
jgi:hypothetical protein